MEKSTTFFPSRLPLFIIVFLVYFSFFPHLPGQVPFISADIQSQADLQKNDPDILNGLYRIRMVGLNQIDLSEEKTISFTLFPDIETEAHFERLDRFSNGGIVWNGLITGSKWGYAMVSHFEGQYFAKIEWEKGTFLIKKKTKTNYYIIQQVIPRQEGPHDGIQPGIMDFENRTSASLCTEDPSCSYPVIDMLIVYTPGAKSDLGGSHGSVVSAVNAAVSEINSISSSSDVPVSFNATHIEEVSYSESGHLSTDLARLRNHEDGYMDNVETLRYNYGCDLVSLIVDQGCGLGYLPIGSFSHTMGFSVVGEICLTSNKSLAHEVGHNLGLRHDRFAYIYDGSPEPPIFCSFSWGHADPAQGWRTIMAYNDVCDCADEDDPDGDNPELCYDYESRITPGSPYCTRISRWSNPDVNYQGNPTGIAVGNSEEANNAYTIRRTACIVASYDADLPSVLPVELILFEAEQKGGTVQLQWQTASEINNHYFELQRSGEGKNFYPLGRVAGNGNSTALNAYRFKDTKPLWGNNYYRIKQVDFDEKYSFSDILNVEFISQKGQIRVFPNPVEEKMNVSFISKEKDNLLLKILDLSGNLIQSKKINLIKGTGSLQWEVGDMPRGVYILQVISLSGQVYSPVKICKL